VDLRVSEGNCIVRAHVACDITSELAREMGWEIYSGGHLISGLEGTTKLTGDLYLERVALRLNGSGAEGLECPATTADAFELSRSKGDTDGSIQTQLRFRLLSTAWSDITEFFGLMGQADGQMHLHRLPEQGKLQPTLEEQDRDDPEDTDGGEDPEDLDPPREPAPAAPPPKKRGRPRKAHPSTITTEAVQ